VAKERLRTSYQGPRESLKELPEPLSEDGVGRSVGRSVGPLIPVLEFWTVNPKLLLP
jgi:hypothetical protein